MRRARNEYFHRELFLKRDVDHVKNGASKMNEILKRKREGKGKHGGMSGEGKVEEEEEERGGEKRGRNLSEN